MGVGLPAGNLDQRFAAAPSRLDFGPDPDDLSAEDQEIREATTYRDTDPDEARRRGRLRTMSSGCAAQSADPTSIDLDGADSGRHGRRALTLRPRRQGCTLMAASPRRSRALEDVGMGGTTVDLGSSAGGHPANGGRSSRSAWRSGAKAVDDRPFALIGADWKRNKENPGG